jgi:hypothetical protein
VDEKVIPIIRNGTWSHSPLILDCVLGHNGSILILIQYSFKILVNVILLLDLAYGLQIPHWPLIHWQCINKVSGKRCFSGDLWVTEC